MLTPSTALQALLLAGAALFALNGCSRNFMHYSDRLPVEHQPKVEAYDLSHTVAGSADAGTFDAAARDALDAFMARQPARARSVVVVASGDPAAQRLGTETVAWLRHEGYEPQGPVAAKDAKAAVQVVVRRYTVTLPACPDFTQYPGNTFANAESSNWGCATATNLGLMVANPGDLIEGRDPGPANGQVQADAMQRYLDGKTKDLAPEDISAVETKQSRSSSNSSSSSSSSNGGGG